LPAIKFGLGINAEAECVIANEEVHAKQDVASKIKVEIEVLSLCVMMLLLLPC